MALKITSATKGAGACQHYTLTVQDGAFTETETVHLDALMEWADTSPFRNRRIALAALWAAYRIKVSGASPASCLNVEIA